MLPCDLALGARIFVAETFQGVDSYRFIVLAASDSDVYSWWKGGSRRLVRGMQLNTDQPLKIVCELNITPNALVEFDVITGAYDELHNRFWGKNEDINARREQLRRGTKHWGGGLPDRAVNAAPAARFSDNVN